MTKISNIKGVAALCDGRIFSDISVVVRFTHDERGETLSLSLSDVVMIMVPFEEVGVLIEEARKEGH